MTLAHGPPAARPRQDDRRVRREVGAGGELLHPAADGGQGGGHGPRDRARAGSVTGEDGDAGETAHAAGGRLSRTPHRRVKAIAVAWRVGAHPGSGRNAASLRSCTVSRKPGAVSSSCAGGLHLASLPVPRDTANPPRRAQRDRSGRWLAHRSPPPGAGPRDRKSTRLNSSHVSISYAVF